MVSIVSAAEVPAVIAPSCFMASAFAPVLNESNVLGYAPSVHWVESR